jgi:hypothetical protein
VASPKERRSARWISSIALASQVFGPLLKEGSPVGGVLGWLSDVIGADLRSGWMKHGAGWATRRARCVPVRDWPALRSGLVLIARDDWRLAYVSAGVDDIHGEMGDSLLIDEKAGSAG